MIHEALFALWSCNNLLLFNKEVNGLLELQEFLHPGERKLLEQIVNVTQSYHKIEDFRRMIANKETREHEDSIQGESITKTDDNMIKCGSYLKAFSNGMDDVLKEYRDAIIELEGMILKNPQLTLSYVFSTVERFTTLFDALKSMIRIVNVEHIYGCLLMSRLHMYTVNGIPTIVRAANTIMQRVNKIFYRHLGHWIVYGNLVDAHNEFFITDCNCPDENFLFPEQMDNGEQISKKSRTRWPSHVRKFMINPELLPSILPLETSESILFMGRIIWIIRNDPELIYDGKFSRDIWEGKSIEQYKRIEELEKQTFNLAHFEKTVKECRLKLSKYLWSVMVEEADLLGHMQIIREYYALGRGELFQQFIVMAEKQMKVSTSDAVNVNLNAIFIETARKMYSENDKTYTRFELIIPKGTDGKDTNLNPLSNLEIYFQIKWPLHIIFHPKVISLYNKLFSFLLRLKKTHIDLHELWLDHMEGKGKIYRGVWTLRHNLMFLVNNLQYYLQVDVIEAHFSLLKEDIKNAKELNDIIMMHSTFLCNLLSKTFIMSTDDKTSHAKRNSLYQLPALNFEGKNMVYNIILQLLQLCDDFCVLASTWNAELSEPDIMQLGVFQKQADAIIEILLRALFSLHEKVSGQHLLQLLHRLDFNRWYSKSKADLNLSVT